MQRSPPIQPLHPSNETTGLLILTMNVSQFKSPPASSSSSCQSNSYSLYKVITWTKSDPNLPLIFSCVLTFLLHKPPPPTYSSSNIFLPLVRALSSLSPVSLPCPLPDVKGGITNLVFRFIPLRLPLHLSILYLSSVEKHPSPFSFSISPPVGCSLALRRQLPGLSLFRQAAGWLNFKSC